MRQVYMGELANGEPWLAVICNLLEQPADLISTNYEEMKRSVALRDQFAQALEQELQTPTLLLEEADWEYLCERVKGPIWQRNSRDLLELIESVLNAPSISLADLQKQQPEDDTPQAQSA